MQAAELEKEAREVQATEAEGVAREVQDEVPVGAQVKVALEKQVAREEEVPAAVVAATAAEDLGEILQGTLRETPTKARSVAAMTMTTPRTTQTRSSRRILQEERARDRRRANPAVAEWPQVASNPEQGTCSILDLVWLTTKRIHQWMTRNQYTISTERRCQQS